MTKIRSFYLSAVLSMAAGAVASAVSISAVPAAAVDTTLSVNQTRALFGDEIPFYYLNTSGGWSSGTFDFLCAGDIHNAVCDGFYDDSQPVDPVSHEVCIYYADISAGNFENTYEQVNIRVKPTVDLSNLQLFQFGIGLSASLPSTFAPNDYDWYVNNAHRLASAFSFQRTDYDSISGVPTTQDLSVGYNWFRTQQNSQRYCPYFYNVLFDRSIYDFDAICPFSYYYINQGVNDLAQTFRLSFDGRNGGLDQLYYFGMPQTYGTYDNDAIGIGEQWDFNYCSLDIQGKYYMIIDCPTISEGYYNNNSGGGSNSGIDISFPDYYSGDLSTIIDKLNQIISDDLLRFSQLGQIEHDVEEVNSRLDNLQDAAWDVNSHLDRTNSELDGIGRKVQGISSKIDTLNSNISGVVGSADSIPDNGMIDSTFERHAGSYIEDMEREYSDPENLPDTEQARGLLTIVWGFITSGRLAATFGIVMLLLLLRYTIFNKGM